jgi:hypothetical protein
MPERELAGYVTRFGPVSRVLPAASAEVRAEFVTKVRAALAPYVQGAELCFTSACWMVTARRA